MMVARRVCIRCFALWDAAETWKPQIELNDHSNYFKSFVGRNNR